MRNTLLKLSFCFALVLVLMACPKPPDFPDEPEIAFVSLSKAVIDEGESISIVFSFQDGDGDLGNEDDSVSGFLIDSRAPGVPETFSIPFVDQVGNIPAISGEITFTPSEPPCINGLAKDSVSYSLYIRDRAGNQSNTIMIPELIINCNP